MRKSKIIIVSLLTVVILLISSCGNNQSDMMGVDINTVDGEKALSTVMELSSEKYHGRITGSEGNELAAKYIAAYFKEIGLVSPKYDMEYLQKYTQPIYRLKKAPELSIKKGEQIITFEYPEQFTLRALSSSTTAIDINAEIYEITSPSEFELMDLKGKAVLVSLETLGLFNSVSELYTKYISEGCAMAIVEYDTSESGHYRNLTVTPMIGPWMSGYFTPLVYVSTDAMKQIRDANAIEYKCSYDFQPDYEASNVVGYIEGKDEEKPIIIGAHFDHVGDNLDGTYNPGALDNASGVAVMLEVARVLKESGKIPQHPIVFVAFNGEESGFQGSTAFVSDPVTSLKDSVMLNLDMLGAATDVPITIGNGNGKSTPLTDSLYEISQELGIETALGEEARSDNYVFEQRGIDSVCLITMEFTQGYHSPEDTSSDVKSENLKKAAMLVLEYINRK